MPTKKKTNVKIPDGTNVRVKKDVYKSVSEYAKKKGLKIGRFFELSAMEKISQDKEHMKSIK